MSATYSIMKKAEPGIQGMDIVGSPLGYKLVVLRMVEPFAGEHYEPDKGRFTIVKGFYLDDLPVSEDEERKVEYESPIREEFHDTIKDLLKERGFPDPIIFAIK